MKTAAILGFSSLLVGLVAAAPLEKRAYVTHTVTEEVIETVDVTVTITVGAVNTPAAAAAAQAAETTKAEEYAWSWDHDQHQAQDTQETEAPAATTTHQEAAYVAQTEAPAATTTTAAPVQEQPKQEEQHQEHQKQQEQPQEQYQEQPKEEAKVEEVQQQASYAQQPSQQSGGGQTYTGDITFYDAGLGSCGWTTDGSSEYVVALSHLLIGEKSNDNPYCGRMIEVTRGGKSVKAKVVDKCMGCAHDNVDLSRVAFNELAHEDEGRVPGCSWRFVD